MNEEKLKELIDVNREALNDPTTTKSTFEANNLKSLLNEVPLDFIKLTILHPALDVNNAIFLTAFKRLTLYAVKDIAEVLAKLSKSGKLNVRKAFFTIVAYGVTHNAVDAFYDAVTEILNDSMTTLTTEFITEVYSCATTMLSDDEIADIGSVDIQKLYTSIFLHPSFSMMEAVTSTLAYIGIDGIFIQINQKKDLGITLDTLDIRDKFMGILYSLTNDLNALPLSARDIFVW